MNNLSWDDLVAYLEAVRFDQVVIPGYAELEAPTEVQLFAYSVYLRSGASYLCLTQVDQGDQLELTRTDRIDHEESLLDDPNIVLTTVDLTSQLVGDVQDFRVVGAVGELTSRSDPAAGRVAALSLALEPEVDLLFDPLSSVGIRVFAARDRLRAGAPTDVVRWAAAQS